MLGFLFAGQGSQAIGMGSDLYQQEEIFRNIFDTYPEIRDLIFKGDKKELDQTKNCQKAILLTSYAIAKVLEKNNIKPDYVAGLSLGEYSALAFSNTWSLDASLEIVTKRGLIMQNALNDGKSGMRAVIGTDEETIKKALAKVSKGICTIANYNCPGQIVITGENEALDEAQKLLNEIKPTRLIPLNVTGAFHSALLNDASNELFEVLKKYEKNKPTYKVLYNYTGDESTEDINVILKEQISHSVYFESIIRNMILKGVDTFIEIGPGKALSSFVRKTNSDVKVFTVNNSKDLELVIGGLK